jgi:hypothetical protein
MLANPFETGTTPSVSVPSLKVTVPVGAKLELFTVATRACHELSGRGAQACGGSGDKLRRRNDGRLRYYHGHSDRD